MTTLNTENAIASLAEEMPLDALVSVLSEICFKKAKSYHPSVNYRQWTAWDSRGIALRCCAELLKEIESRGD